MVTGPLVVRLRGHYFALITLLLSLTSYYVALSQSWLTGGDDSYPFVIPRLHIAGASWGWRTSGSGTPWCCSLPLLDSHCIPGSWCGRAGRTYSEPRATTIARPLLPAITSAGAGSRSLRRRWSVRRCRPARRRSGDRALLWCDRLPAPHELGLDAARRIEAEEVAAALRELQAQLRRPVGPVIRRCLRSSLRDTTAAGTPRAKDRVVAARIID